MFYHDSPTITRHYAPPEHLQFRAISRAARPRIVVRPSGRAQNRLIPSRGEVDTECDTEHKHARGGPAAEVSRRADAAPARAGPRDVQPSLATRLGPQRRWMQGRAPMGDAHLQVRVLPALPRAAAPHRGEYPMVFAAVTCGVGRCTLPQGRLARDLGAPHGAALRARAGALAQANAERTAWHRASEYGAHRVAACRPGRARGVAPLGRPLTRSNQLQPPAWRRLGLFACGGSTARTKVLCFPFWFVCTVSQRRASLKKAWS